MPALVTIKWKMAYAIENSEENKFQSTKSKGGLCKMAVDGVGTGAFGKCGCGIGIIVVIILLLIALGIVF
jgi:hypothetical protein